MKKYYRVKIGNFLWQEGAILVNGVSAKDGVRGYEPIEDIWDTTSVNGTEYITAAIVEHPNNAEIFERVYPDSVTGKIFKTKDQLKEMYKDAFVK